MLRYILLHNNVQLRFNGVYITALHVYTCVLLSNCTVHIETLIYSTYTQTISSY